MYQSALSHLERHKRYPTTKSDKTLHRFALVAWNYSNLGTVLSHVLYDFGNVAVHSTLDIRVAERKYYWITLKMSRKRRKSPVILDFPFVRSNDVILDRVVCAWLLSPYVLIEISPKQSPAKAILS